MFKLKACLGSTNISPKICLKLFDQLVKPIALYGSEIWGCMKITKKKLQDHDWMEKMYEMYPAEKLNTSFGKNVLGVNRKTTNAAVLGELGRYPLGINIIISMLKYKKHLEETNNKLLHGARRESTFLHNDGNSSYMTFIDKCCEKLKINSQDLITSHEISNIRNTLKENFINFWEKQIGRNLHSEGKMCTYRKVKFNFIYENYLDVVYRKDHRVALTKFRVSAHKLEIEKGRYERPYVRREDRKCRHCKSLNKEVVGNEMHFLMECPLVEDMRTKLWKEVYKKCKYFNSMSQEERFIYLLTSEGETIRGVAQFCAEGFKRL